MQGKPTSDAITIVGAGLAGSLLAIFLAKRGIRVDMIERRPDPRHMTTSAGRSINLALSTRGLHALNQVGLADVIRQQSVIMRGRMIHTLDGDVTFQPYGKDETEVLYAVSRHDLQCQLLRAAENYADVSIAFQQRCIGANSATGELCLRHEVTAQECRRPPGCVIGTDGSASAIRHAMLTTPRFNFSQTYLEHGYKELTIPAGPHGTYQLEPHALHIWPRRAYMLIALPNLDGSFTCTLFLPFDGEPSFAHLTSDAAIRHFFHTQFPDVVPLIPDLAESFISNPTGSLVTIKCEPWYIADRLLLLGDAAHAIVPFFGQGMNCAFEDCTVFDACIETYGTDWARVFAAFSAARKPNTDAIADMAVAHYIEMRDRVADPHFLLQKQIEQELAKCYPQQYITQYALVTFHRIPYAEARDRAQVQDHILQELSASIVCLDAVDWAKAERLITQELG
jgi:kynurenine 3-monooxygenase